MNKLKDSELGQPKRFFQSLISDVSAAKAPLTILISGARDPFCSPSSGMSHEALVQVMLLGLTDILTREKKEN